MTPERPDFLPPPPWEGPPFPGATWREKAPGNPGPALEVADNPEPVLAPELEAMAEAKRLEWEAQGYPPGLINKALHLSVNMVEGLLGSPLIQTIKGSSVEREVRQRLYRTGLDAADKWLQSMRSS